MQSCGRGDTILATKSHNLATGYHHRNELPQAVQVVEYARAFHMPSKMYSHWLACYEVLHGLLAGDLKRLTIIGSGAIIKSERALWSRIFRFFGTGTRAHEHVAFDAYATTVIEAWREHIKGDRSCAAHY